MDYTEEELSVTSRDNLARIVLKVQGRIEELEAQKEQLCETMEDRGEGFRALRSIEYWSRQPRGIDPKTFLEFIHITAVEALEELAVPRDNDQQRQPVKCLKCGKELTWGSDGWYCEYCGAFQEEECQPRTDKQRTSYPGEEEK